MSGRIKWACGALLSLAVASMSFGAPATQPAGRAPSMLPGGADKWELTWSDEFDYADADLEKKWVSQNGPSGHILCSRWRENVKVENGTLKLINRKENRGGQNWTSGNIWTQKWFQYGYFECRYRYAAAEATNNSFWIMTQRKERPEKGANFEIDINEGHFPATVNTNIHNWSDLVEVNGRKISARNPKAFHYGLQPDRVIQLEAPIVTRKVRLITDHPTHFHVREFRIFGVKPGGGYPSVKAPVPAGGPVDFARDPNNKVTVSGFFKGASGSTPSNKTANLFDNDPATSWITQPEGQKFLEIEFPEPRTLGCLQFLHGWTERSGGWTGLLTAYKVQYHNGTDWVDMATYSAENADVNFARDYNTFGLEWTETELIFYLNGKEIRRVKNEFCHSPAPIWLSLAIIPWHGRVTDKIDGTFMEVDYVRVYQRKPITP